MAELTITADVSCAACGGALETKDGLRTADSVVTCSECGAVIGTYGEVDAERRRRAHAAGVDVIRNSLRRGFRKGGLGIR